jgi:hypothetical protein
LIGQVIKLRMLKLWITTNERTYDG